MRALLSSLLLLIAAGAARADADSLARLVRGLSRTERAVMDSMATYSVAHLQQAAEAADSDRVEARMREILALGSLNLGARALDEEGRAAIHRYLEAELERLAPHGVEVVGAYRSRVAVPVRADRLRPDAEPPALVADGRTFDIQPLYPNGAMPSLAPRGGLTGPLVDAGTAGWSEVNGLDLHGAVALVRFEAGNAMSRVFELGAVAAVVIEDDFVTRDKAQGLFSHTPAPFPRYFVRREAGDDLIELARTRTEVTVTGGHEYAWRPTESVFAYLPPTEEIRFTIRESDLIDRIALQFDSSARDIMRVNRLESPHLVPPAPSDAPTADSSEPLRLIIPNQTQPYTVAVDDLYQRIRREFGVEPRIAPRRDADGIFLKVDDDGNPVPPDPSLEPLIAGDEITIPNLQDSLVVLVHTDSVSVVPDEPHGAYAAGNVAAALTLLEHMATRSPNVRRKGLVVGFLEGDLYGGATTRGIAEQALLTHPTPGRRLRPLESTLEGTRERVLTFFITLGGVVAATALVIVLLRTALKDWGRAHPGLASLAIMGGLAFGAVLGRQVARPVVALGAAEEESDLGWTMTRYRDTRSWFEDGGLATDHVETVRWFVEDWLRGRIEDLRIRLAEERVVVRNRVNELEAGRLPVPADLRDRLTRLNEDILMLAGLRDQSLERRGTSSTERAELFFRALGEAETAGELDAYPELTRAALRDRFEAEYGEERMLHEMDEGNRAFVQDLRRALAAGADGADSDRLGLFLDLSHGSRTLGLQVGGGQATMRQAYLGGPQYGPLINRYAPALAFAGLKAGWPEGWPMVREADRPVFPQIPSQHPPAFPEFWAALRVGVLPLGTVNDRLDLLDTPRDRLESVHVPNLAVQIRSVLMVTSAALENHLDSTVPARVASAMSGPAYGKLVGRALTFNIRSGLDAQEPVPGAYLYYPGIKHSPAGVNSLAYRGARAGNLMIAQLNGGYDLPLETLQFARSGQGLPHVYAYGLDPELALFTQAANQGQIGTRTQSPSFTLTERQTVQKDIILTEVYPRTFFLAPDPMEYASMGGGQHAADNIRVFDAVLNGEPDHYALDNAFLHYREDQQDLTILYMPPGRRARIQVRSGNQYKLLLLGDLEADLSTRRAQVVGRGYSVGPDGDDRNLAVPMTVVRFTREMQELADRQQELFQSHGITDQGINQALARSAEKLAEAEAALHRHDWQAAQGLSREAWGMLIKTYPRLLALGREAVFSVVILMALLVPAAVFTERLAIGARTILGHLGGVVAIFVAGAVFLNFFHPAFKISVSPFILMIAFVMILMSSVVLAICYQRFDVLVRRARIAGGEVESEEISLFSSLGTALSLGVSNLKKRPSRTLLTVVTVSVLTFSIITFVSVRGQQGLQFRPLALDSDVEGRTVEPLPPAYEGVMFRGPMWSRLPRNMVSSLISEFGVSHAVARRGYYMEVEGGNNADREGRNQVAVRHGNRTWVGMAVTSFEPIEREFSGLDRAVTAGTWVRGPEERPDGQPDRLHVLLPLPAAEDLGISEADLVDAEGRLRPDEELPEVAMLNLRWRVIGIFDPALADRIRDVNGKSLAVVDYLRSAFTPAAAPSGADIQAESESYHLSWDRFVMVPVAAASVAAEIVDRSVAVKFAPDEDRETFFRDLALRTNRSVFAAEDGRPSLLTTRQRTDIGGLAKILVPVILCILIVSNTMMGGVEERKGEVGMLGAIGLSPSQIAFLLLSESSVFSVLGVVIGTFLGLGFGSFVPWVQTFNPTFLEGLSFNFTSLASIFLAAATALVVLLATMFPARAAAALAAPSGMAKWELPPPGEDARIRFDLPFTLTKGNAVGMVAFFRRFLLNHTEATSPDFNCRHILHQVRNGGSPALDLGADMWLAPYDLDVAQQLRLRIAPTETEGVFGVALDLYRHSGTEEAWMRTNYGFMDLVRRQFLIWRNLDEAARRRFIDEGADLIRAVTDDNPARTPTEPAHG